MKTPISNTINCLHAVVGRQNTPKYALDGSFAGAITGAGKRVLIGTFFCAGLYFANDMEALSSLKFGTIGL